jgi:tight adherence protein C
MTGLAPIAIVCGLGLGLGLWLLVSMAPRLHRPSFTSRVAPYVVDISVDARVLLERTTANPLPVFGAIFGPIAASLRGLISSLVGGDELAALRLRQAGLTISVEEFRSRQLLWAASGAAIAIVTGFTVSNIQAVPIAAPLALVIVAAVAAFVLRDYVLQRAARARVVRMTKELPTVLEFLTLSLSAGEGILDAVRRIARISSGELAAELSRVPRDVSVGIPLGEALDELSRQLRMPPLTRAIEQITGALERGTPLAEVLRAQAQDAREGAKRELLETSGKKEVAMMVPLVFLILPITIAIAIFPGLFVLQLGFE